MSISIHYHSASGISCSPTTSLNQTSKISQKSTASISLFSSKDKFYSKDRSDPKRVSEGSLNWGNLSATFNLGTRFNPRVFGNAKFTTSRYAYEIKTKVNNEDDIPFKFTNSSGNGSISVGYNVDFPEPDKPLITTN